MAGSVEEDQRDLGQAARPPSSLSAPLASATQASRSILLVVLLVGSVDIDAS